MGCNNNYENKKEIYSSGVVMRCCLRCLNQQTKSYLVEIYCRNVYFLEFIIIDRDVRNIVILLLFDKCAGYAKIITETKRCNNIPKIKKEVFSHKTIESSFDSMTWCCILSNLA